MGQEFRSFRDLSLKKLENLTIQELDEILENNYGYRFFGFNITFAYIMGGAWSKDKNGMKRIEKFRKEKKCFVSHSLILR